MVNQSFLKKAVGEENRPTWNLLFPFMNYIVLLRSNDVNGFYKMNLIMKRDAYPEYHS